MTSDALNLFAPNVDLDNLASKLRHDFAAAHPFPHVVIDGLFSDAALRSVLMELPNPDDQSLYRSEKPSLSEKKSAFRDWSRMGPHTLRTFGVLQSGLFISFLETLTGFSGLISDPTLNGGGVHMIRPGGMLEIHADFNIHPTLKLRRRLNVLIYLNADWVSAWGGELELWNRDMAQCAAKVEPVFNRTVIFETASDSFHGHPQPLDAPPGRARISIALYYYTSEGANEASHSTLYQQRTKT